MSNKPPLDLAKYSDDELETVACIPNEVAKEFVEELYKFGHISRHRYNDDEKQRNRVTNRSSAYKLTRSSNKTIRDIELDKKKFVGLDTMDKITVGDAVPFDLQMVIDRCIEYAEENNLRWPIDFCNTDYSRKRLRIAYGERR